jgi:metallophosphoesterase (TIGR00282 family)
MKIGFIGDIVGRPGRKMVKSHLANIRQKEGLDYVIANYENASHGYGLTPKNANELFNAGIDVMTGGNHTWDKKEIISLLDELPILRPINYPQEVPGEGYRILDDKLAVVNVMGHFTMPMVNNPFIETKRVVELLKKRGVENIFIDFHAEATSEKMAMFLMLKNQISALAGTHTHVGTDDLVIDEGCGYVTDVGLTGCRDNVIGMSADVPIKKFLTGLPGRYDVPNKCKKIFQMVVFELEEGRCKDAYKIKAYDDEEYFISMRAFCEK